MSCTYCDSDLSSYEPVTVQRRGESVGNFCNYACLAAYIDTENLSEGAACQWQ